MTRCRSWPMRCISFATSERTEGFLNMREPHPPYAVIVGLDTLGGLQSARIMAGHEVPVVGIARNLAHFACRTKACKRIIGADTASNDCVNALRALGPEFVQKAVLFPCTDKKWARFLAI